MYKYVFCAKLISIFSPLPGTITADDVQNVRCTLERQSLPPPLPAPQSHGHDRFEKSALVKLCGRRYSNPETPSGTNENKILTRTKRGSFRRNTSSANKFTSWPPPPWVRQIVRHWVGAGAKVFIDIQFVRIEPRCIVLRVEFDFREFDKLRRDSQT